jgi:hypothetical protein
MNVLSDELHQNIVNGLAIHYDVESKDGVKGPLSQTGEEYIELIVRASTIKALGSAIMGAISAFGRGKGSTCYWRTKTEVDLESGSTPRAYLRFCVSNRPELSQEQAA